jgi:hypothetical protein
MYLTKKEQKELVVKKSQNGKGIFAQKEFKPEQVIFQFAGKLISCDADDDTDDITRSNTIRYDENWFVSPVGRIGDFLNHSCEPNAKAVKQDKKLLIVAIKPIKKGEEVVIDYSTVIASDDIWEMECGCGSDSCRGVVKQFQKLPKKVKEYYISQKIVPKYILAL